MVSYFESGARRVSRESLADLAANDLMLYIRTSGLSAGDRLPPERILVRELAVSRNVLREAVAGLRSRGLLTSRRGSGVFLAGELPDGARADIDSIAEHLEVLEARLALEVEAAALAAIRLTQKNLAELSEIFEILGSQSSEETNFRADMKFHRAIIRATGNQQMLEIEDGLIDKMAARHRLRFEVDPRHYGEAYTDRVRIEHARILHAVEARDPQRARDAMRLHLSGAIHRYKAFMARQGATG